jgi:hypothetical protein
MGILDEAIRDHLELKRKGGTQEADLRRLEDEAFGAPGRSGEPASGVAVPTQAPEAPESETTPGEWPEERSEAVPEEGDAPAAEAPSEGQVAFHDFAAEEGLVGPRAEAASAAPIEEEMAPAPPTDEITFDDTQPHDMQTELRAPGEGPPAEAPEPVETEIDDDLELTLDDEDLEPSGSDEGAEQDAEGGEPPGEPELTVVEEEIVEGEIEVEEPGGEEAPGDEGEDVLEETPDFLRETPEHDRLWFEQKPPKDFDFDDD